MDVLIIESDAEFASRLQSVLQSRGLSARICSDGEAALEQARQHPPAAVVLALELGDKPSAGFSWCNRFKRDEGLRHIPLVLTSSLATPETFAHHQRLKTRADAYLHKPFEPERLLDSLRSWLRIDAPPAGSDEALAAELLGEDDIEAIEAEEVDPVDHLDELFVDLADAPANDAPTAEKTVVGRHRDEPLPETTGIAHLDASLEVTRIDDGAPPTESTTAAGANPRPGEIDELRSAIAELESRIADQDAELAGTRGEAAALQERLDEAEAELADARNEAASLRERLEQAEAELARAREELDAARRESEDRAAQVAKVREEWERTAGELEQTAAILEQTRTELEQANAELEARNAALGQAHAVLERTASDLEARTAALDRAQEELERMRSERDQAQAAADGELAQLRTALEEAQKALQVEAERRERALQALVAAHAALRGEGEG